MLHLPTFPFCYFCNLLNIGDPPLISLYFPRALVLYIVLQELWHQLSFRCELLLWKHFHKEVHNGGLKMLLPTHVKLNDKLYCLPFLIFSVLSLLFCYSLFDVVLYWPLYFSHMVLYQLIPQVNVMFRRQEYLILFILVGCFMIYM